MLCTAAVLGWISTALFSLSIALGIWFMVAWRFAEWPVFWQAIAIVFLLVKVASVASSAAFAVKCQAARGAANANATGPRAQVDYPAMEMGAVPATSVEVVGEKM